MSNEEKQAEISERRNNIEPKLRKIVQKQLKIILGEKEAKKVFLSKFDANKKAKYEKLQYEDLFDPNKSEIYFRDLENFIVKYWGKCFKNIFDTDIDKFKARMILINYSRKGDSHAAEISEPDMQSFRGAMSWLEVKINDFFE